jgi:hypothetical protein
MNFRKLAAEISAAALVAWGITVGSAAPAMADPAGVSPCVAPSCYSLENPFGAPIAMRYNSDNHVLDACYTPRGLTVQIQIAFVTSDKPLEPKIVNRRADSGSWRSCIVAAPQGQAPRVLAVRGCVSDTAPTPDAAPNCWWTTTGADPNNAPLGAYFLVNGHTGPAPSDPGNPGAGVECVNGDPYNCWFLV